MTTSLSPLADHDRFREPPAALSPAAVQAGEAIREWLLTDARIARDPALLLGGWCERLNEAGVPVDRASSVILTLHSEQAAISRFWAKGEPMRFETFPYIEGDREGYLRSPFYHVHQTREPLSLWLPDTPDERFGIVADLKARGFVHYFCFPLFFANGDDNGISVATRHPQGFTPEHFALISYVMPALIAVMEIIAGYRRLETILRIYVGEEPHTEILSGQIHRGQIRRIRSAILFADMRGYTRRTSAMEPEAAAMLLNQYFDCLVPPIEGEGGEVLKYMGDGLLAIFRDKGDDTGGAPQAALDAARLALSKVAAWNAGRGEDDQVGVGIALHHGDAAYGNVGSGERLDFTVVGRDVNIASRVARLNKALNEPLLMTKIFADHLWIPPRRVGSFAVDGIEQEIEVYKP